MGRPRNRQDGTPFLSQEDKQQVSRGCLHTSVEEGTLILISHRHQAAAML